LDNYPAIKNLVRTLLLGTTVILSVV